MCQVWREIFVSRPSLWTDFNCTNADKTRVYLERSKSSPINLRLKRFHALSSDDPFHQIIPHSVGRLESLSVTGRPGSVQDIVAHLSHRAPLLARLGIDGGSQSRPQRNPVLTTALFNGDLSSLRELRLQYVRTELPWRSMANLTSFTLSQMLPGDLSITQLLDFFESAPRLRNIKLDSATPVTGGQDGRLVSLDCLKTMDILRGDPSSLLLDHLVIPAGAKLTEWVPSFGPALGNYLPKSLDNLENIHNFTEVHLKLCEHHRHIQLSGPNGRLSIVSSVTNGDFALGCVVRFDASNAERLVASSAHGRTVLAREGLEHLQNLRTLTFSRCVDPYYFMANLHPDKGLLGPCPALNWRNSFSFPPPIPRNSTPRVWWKSWQRERREG